MRRFRIEYRDSGDSGCPVMSSTWRGHDAEHATERFFEAPDGDGWEIVKIFEVGPIRFWRHDRDAREVLMIVRAEDKLGTAVTSSFEGINGDRSEDYPYLIQITSGPDMGDDFVGLYTLDGDRVELGNGWTWEVVGEAPIEVVNAIETGWETGTSVVTRI